jgi:cell wall-associated NlpC family hydrolase
VRRAAPALAVAAALTLFGGCAAVSAVLGGSGQAAAAPVSCDITVPDADTGVPLDAEQWANAATIVAETLRPATEPAFTRPALPVRAAVVAVATARQESVLRNLPDGDRDSIGLFQQRPSQGWGTPEQLADPVYATDAFLGRLVLVPGWDSIPLTEAAQAVQRSATPDAYAQWEPLAVAVVAALGGGDQAECQGGTGIGPAAPPSEKAAAALAAAESQVGVPYVWGGGDAAGPTGGGFDCSGLMLFAWAQVGVTLSHSSAADYDQGRRIPTTDAQPGDLIFLSSDGTPGGIHHVAMVYAPGQIIEAQQTGVPVHIRQYAGPAEPEIMPWVVRLP